MVSTVSTDNNTSSLLLAWAKGLRGLLFSALQTTGNPPLPPAPGSPHPWQPAYPVYSGVVNLATGNLKLFHHMTSWGCKGLGIAFTLVFNSQSTRSDPLGNKWTHSYNWRVLSEADSAVVITGDGTEITFTLSGGSLFGSSQRRMASL